MFFGFDRNNDFLLEDVAYIAEQLSKLTNLKEFRLLLEYLNSSIPAARPLVNWALPL